MEFVTLPIRASFTGALGCSLPILLLLTPLVLGSPAQAQRGRRPALGTAAPVPMQPSWQSPRELERANHDLAEAQRHLAEASFFAQRGSSPEAARLLELSRQSLTEAQNALQRGNVFAVREQAKAAENLAKAAKALYEAELGFGSRPGRSFFEAPLRAQESLSRLQAEMAFANITAGPVAELQQQAQQLLSRVNTDPGSYTFADYSRSKAAHHSARAALHLLAAERLSGLGSLGS
ncbi:hypothetical protein NW863_03680, partial [Synechococcus sp. B60.1]|uniref:hypothetical protein n=1 Tax=Synechococcus sp. B60.1 TaxID=2964522 RepID=UPI0039C0D256